MRDNDLFKLIRKLDIQKVTSDDIIRIILYETRNHLEELLQCDPKYIAGIIKIMKQFDNYGNDYRLSDKATVVYEKSRYPIETLKILTAQCDRNALEKLIEMAKLVDKAPTKNIACAITKVILNYDYISIRKADIAMKDAEIILSAQGETQAILASDLLFDYAMLFHCNISNDSSKLICKAGAMLICTSTDEEEAKYIKDTILNCGKDSFDTITLIESIKSKLKRDKKVSDLKYQKILLAETAELLQLEPEEPREYIEDPVMAYRRRDYYRSFLGSSGTVLTDEKDFLADLEYFNTTGIFPTHHDLY